MAKTIYNFDQIIDRRHSDSVKWRAFDEDVLPLWVADMDFPAPEPVIRALRERVEQGVFGYGAEPAGLRDVIVARLADRYDWRVAAEDLLFVPGVVTAFNIACHATGSPGDGVLVQTPVYYPMLDAPAHAGRTRAEMELTREPNGRYVVDADAFEAALTKRTRLFLLCNPHNPVGRVFDRGELARMAEICLRHDVTICSDEIHCDLLLDGHRHVPIASLAPEIAARTITLMAPSKTYNVAGLHCSVAIIQNKALREQYQRAQQGLVSSVNIMGFVAALAAYRDGQPWLNACLAYLNANCDYLEDYVAAKDRKSVV